MKGCLLGLSAFVVACGSGASSTSDVDQCTTRVVIDSKSIDVPHDALCQAEKDGKLAQIDRTEVGITSARCAELCGGPDYTDCPFPDEPTSDFYDLHKATNPAKCPYADAKVHIKMTCGRTQPRTGPCPPPG